MRVKAILKWMLLLVVLGSVACERTEKSEVSQEVSGEESRSVDVEKPQRIVALGGPITEIVYALGAGDEVVGADITSTYPESVTALPRVGMFRSLAAEGVLSLTPTMVLGIEGVGPDTSVEQIRAAGIDVEIFDEPKNFEQATQRIQKVAKVIGRTREAESVIETMRSEYDQATEIAQKSSVRPRVLFLYARGANTLLVGGKNTSAETMITLAGGVNAVDFEGFKPLSPEGLIAAKPDVLLMAEKGVESLGIDELWKLNGLDQTPAGRERRLISIDDAKLLGLGPRFGSALIEVATQLHESKKSGDVVGER